MGWQFVAAQDSLHYLSYLKKHHIRPLDAKHQIRYQRRDAEQLIKLWDSLYPDRKVELYNYLSSSQWEEYFLFYIKGARAANDYQLLRRLSYRLAIVYHRQTKFAQASPLFEQVMVYKNELSRPQLQELMLRLEFCYRSTGEFSKAIQIRKSRIAYGFINNFWELYAGVGLYNEAIQDFKLFEKFPQTDDFEKIRYFNKIGNLYLDNRQPDSAISYFVKMKAAASYVLRTPNYLGKNAYSESVKVYYAVLADANIAEAYMQKGRYEKAIPKLLLAVAECKRIAEVDQKIIKWLDLAECYLQLNKAGKAQLYLDSAKAAMTFKRMLPSELRLLKLYASCRQQLGDMQGHLRNLENYLQLKDSILSINQKNQSVLMLANLDVQRQKILLSINQKELDNARKEQQYQRKVIFFTIWGILALVIISGLLYYQSVTQTRNRKAIAAQNEQLLKNEIKINKQKEDKETLLKEVHHRVKNNLQVVYSLLNLQKRRVDTPEVKQTLEAVQNRIRSMAIVHQQLYSDDSLREIDAGNYIKNLVTHLQNIFSADDQEVEITYAIDRISLSLEKAIPIGLIINEAVSNAFKYAFVENARASLKISLKKRGIDHVLKIEDNGMGFTDEAIEATSLGMQLIHNMSDQLKAKYTRSSDRGTSHQFNFQIA